MSDDFGTINARRGERAREIEVLRQHYRQHRDALVRMTTDAPTDHLASEYQRLIAEIDRALGKLDELEGRPAAAAAVPPPHPARAHGDPHVARSSSAGMRPLAGHDTDIDTDLSEPAAIPPPDDGYQYEQPRSRLFLILGVALLALAAVAGLAWWASTDRGPAAGAIVEDTAATTTTTTAAETTSAPDTVAEPVSTALSVTPPSHDYGTIRKGTRAVRQYEVSNNTDEPVTIQVARSACRCLYYDYTALVPPRAKETVTVTVDAAKAKAGELRESIRVSSRSDPSVGTSLDVIATVQ